MMKQQTGRSAREMDRGRAAILAFVQSGEIRPEDIAHLRRDVLAAGPISPDEAEALFALETSAARKCAEWTEFFVEALTDYVIWGLRPTGVVNESQGEWLIARADAAASLNALALLVNVLAEAHRVPLWFVAAVRARGSAGWSGVEIALQMTAAETAVAA